MDNPANRAAGIHRDFLIGCRLIMKRLWKRSTTSQNITGIRKIGLILTGYRNLPVMIKASVAVRYEGIKTDSRDLYDRNTPIQEIREAITIMMGIMLFDQKRG
jgi:hypothetical protein